MTIANEITRLQTAKANIKTSIENKGVTVPSSTTLDGYSTLIDSIVSGKRVATGTFTVSSNINSGYVTVVTVANLGFDPKYIVIYNPSFSATANHVMYASCVPYNTTSYYKHTFKKASSNYNYTSSSGNRNPSSAGEVGVRNSEIQFYAGSSYIMGAGTWQYFAVEAIV